MKTRCDKCAVKRSVCPALKHNSVGARKDPRKEDRKREKACQANFIQKGSVC